MRHYHVRIVGIGLLGIIVAAGCAGKGERIDLDSPHRERGRREGRCDGVPRPSRFSRLRTIAPTDLVSVPDITSGAGRVTSAFPTARLSEATAQAFADYLKGKGWNATVAEGNRAAGADMTITGELDRCRRGCHRVASDRPPLTPKAGWSSK